MIELDQGFVLCVPLPLPQITYSLGLGALGIVPSSLGIRHNSHLGICVAKWLISMFDQYYGRKDLKAQWDAFHLANAIEKVLMYTYDH